MLGKMNWANLFDYQVQPSDMELFQTYMTQNLKQLMLGERTLGLIYGGKITIISGLQIQISAGVAIMPDGTLLQFPAINAVLSAADPSNPRFDRIELAFVSQNNTSVVDVNSQSKVLDIIYQPSVNIVVGTPSATPVVPVQTPANLSLGFIRVNAGQAALIVGNISQIVDNGFQTSAIQLGDKSAFIRYNMTMSQLQYSNDGVRYQAFGSGGGGGGGGANWQGVAGAAATETFEFDEKALVFAQGASQAVVLFVRVPSSYLPGSPISMKLDHYSPGISGAFKFQATASLVRKGLDPVDSIANQYVSTNGDQPLSSTANQLLEVPYDLSSPTGAINGVPVSPGDLIKVQLQRVVTFVTESVEDARMIPSSTEISFSN